MSSGDALFDMRISGLTRLRAAIATSSDGKELSVTAINGHIIVSFPIRTAQLHHRLDLPQSSSVDRRVNAVGWPFASQDCEDVVHHDVRHLFPDFHDATAKVRGEDDVGQFEECRMYYGLVFEDVEASTGGGSDGSSKGGARAPSAADAITSGQADVRQGWR